MGGEYFVSMTMPTEHHDSVVIHIAAIISACLIHFVICYAETTALGSLLEQLGFFSSALRLTNDFVKAIQSPPEWKKNEIKSRN